MIKRQLHRLWSELTRTRVLAALLLASIAWGSTIEFTHHHGSQTPEPLSISSNDGQNTQLAEQIHNMRVETGQPEPSSSKSGNGSECLICQLHFNLAATVLSEPAGISSAEVHAANTPARPFIQLSESTATQQGRAPPINL